METIGTTRRASGTLHAAAALLIELDLPPEAMELRTDAMAVAELVRGLDADDEVVIAAQIAPLLSGGYLDRETAEKRFGPEPVRLARALDALGRFGLPAGWTPERGLEAGQAEALRKMLLAVIGDVRLVVVRLAEQLHRLRGAKRLGAERQRRHALETREVYAPLANRLGVWQVKWEMEDLAFRYLEPARYREIAAALNERRAERERYIEELKHLLAAALRAAGIVATVEGRPKHIYSIWRKMHAKNLAFEQLMDLRAARVLVDDVADCYAALGVVHSLWPPIAHEYDDYIATPKANAYRSIHTAVSGPKGRPVEIQIRTHHMHAESERGVAAHWRYKEGGRSERAYADKINELRALLAPTGRDGEQDFLERARRELFHDRLYVISPKGEIVDVPVGGTPLDFAYQVHTDLGHRTRGARVNGRMVTLDRALENGDTVEIIAGKAPQPSRDWMAAGSGYIASARHRNKVRAWFRRHADPPAAPSAPPGPEAAPAPAPAEPAPGRLRPLEERMPDLEVHGIDDLLSTYARCCKPVPPEPIAGYITVGRGVSIHGRSCANLARLAARAPDRILAVAWGRSTASEFPVDIEVQAFDRRGLVRDVSATLADEKISIQGMTTFTDRRDHIAHLQFAIAVSGLPQLARLLTRIAQVPNVIDARRQK